MRPVSSMKRPIAISFDLGQTLLELDENRLAEQVNAQGYRLDATRVPSKLGRAWHAYNIAKSQGLTGYHAWSAFMHHLLEQVEVRELASSKPISVEAREQLVRYLWSQQPEHNLWCRPIAGIPELLADLSHSGIALGVLTNSEGRAKELIDEVGLGPFINAVVDSGVEGIEKPDPRIFQTLATRLGFAPEEMIHVGDSYEADVLGAIGVGMTPVWLSMEPTVTLPPGVLLCRNTDELRRLLLPS
jgi:putative hydrolase of the HAD superfamily